MASKNPQDVAAKWSKNLGAAGDSIRQGVNSVTVSPGEKAARNVDAYLRGVQQSVADGKYQAGLRSFSLQDWKDSMINKGLARIGPGAMQGKPKMEQFLSKFLPHVEAGQRALESMPRGDLNQNIQRALFMMEHNAKFKKNS